MATNRSDQILRFLVQAEGTDALKPFTESVKELEGAGEETKKSVDALLKELTDAQRLTKTVEEYRKIGLAVVDLSKRYDEAKLRVQTLGKELSATETPSKKQKEAFDNARDALAKLDKQYESQLGKLRDHKTEMVAAGLATNNFSLAQRQIKENVSAAATALNNLAAQSRAAKDAQAALAAAATASANAEAEAAKKISAAQAVLAAELADTAKAFQQENAAAASTREALEKLRAKTKEAADAQNNAAAHSGTLGNAWQRLTAIGATLAGYLSISSAVTGIKNMLGLADASEKVQLRLDALYGGQDAGAAAFGKLRDLAKETGQQFGVTAESAAKLKSFGLEPLDGTLEALINQNARLGGSQETLNGLILAVGQAWSKQKLQGEEILQLVERGVPVWDLLARATGKNVIELQALSAAGKLGRAEIAALVREIGQSAAGATSANLSTLGGLIGQVQARWEDFLLMVANSGVLDYAKQQIGALIEEGKRLAADGSLAEYAKVTANAIKQVGETIVAATKFVYDHAGAVAFVVKTYATFKIAEIVVGLGAKAAAWYDVAAATYKAGETARVAYGKYGSLLGTLLRMPATMQTAIVVVGYEVLAKTADLLAEIAARNSDVARIVQETAAARQKAAQDEINALRLAQQATIEYADVQVKSALQVAELSADELAAYQSKIASAKEFALQQLGIALRQQEIRGATVETNDAVAEATARVAELNAGIGLVAEGSKLAAATMKSGIGAAAEQIVAQLGDITTTASAAETQIGQLFTDIETANVTRLGDIALALTAVSAESDKAAASVSIGLGAALAEVSGAELLKFQSAAQAAFESFGVSAERSADVSNAVLLEALKRLGLQGDILGQKLTAAGADTIAVFSTVAESANSTGAQIEAAFKAALGTIGTSGEAEALAVALEAAGARGKLSLDEVSRSAAALRARLAELKGATDPLSDSFERLGITSQRELDRAATAAKEAFAEIVRGSKSGVAASQDIERAFQAYAQAAIEAGDTTTQSSKDQIAQQIELAGRVAGVRDELISTATAALQAGNQLAQAGNAAVQGFEQIAASTAEAAKNIDDVKVAAKEAASAFVELMNAESGAADQNRVTSVALGESVGAIQDGIYVINESINVNRIAAEQARTQFELLNPTAKAKRLLLETEKQSADQKAKANELIAREIKLLEEQNPQLSREDELRAALVAKYGANADGIERLLALQIEQNKERAAGVALGERELAQDQALGNREYNKSIRVDVRVSADASAGQQTLSQSVLDQIVTKISPIITRAVLDQIRADQSAAGY